MATPPCARPPNRCIQASPPPRRSTIVLTTGRQADRAAGAGGSAAPHRPLRHRHPRAASEAGGRASVARSGGRVPRSLGAFEEKNRLINEAEGYRNEQVALARGNAEAQLENAAAYTLGRINRAAGRRRPLHPGGAGLSRRARPHRDAAVPGNHGAGAAGQEKLIVDSSKGRRHLLLLEDGVEIAPPAMPCDSARGPRRRVTSQHVRKRILSKVIIRPAATVAACC